MIDVIAILCSDIHLSDKCPVARSMDADWFLAMKESLGELSQLQRENDCPVLFAGDLFDKWKSSPRLINFALVNLPNEMYCIPGQHDLPMHNLDSIEDGAYWTLVEAGKICDLSFGSKSHHFPSFSVYGFPWGKKIESLFEKEQQKTLKVCLVHQYVWKEGCSFPGVSNDSNVKNAAQEVRNYDVAVFGDNHKGFIDRRKGRTLLNCGSFMKRAADQVKYHPRVGLLLADGTVKQYRLKTKQQVSRKHLKKKKEQMDLSEVLNEVKGLQNSDLDFRVAVLRYLEDKKVDSLTKKCILEALEE